MDYKQKIVPLLTKLKEDRYRIEFTMDEAEYLTLYYEKAKSGYVNKPIGYGWTCVEAKVSEGDLYSLFPGLTPRMMMEWGQEIMATLNSPNS